MEPWKKGWTMERDEPQKKGWTTELGMNHRIMDTNSHGEDGEFSSSCTYFGVSSTSVASKPTSFAAAVLFISAFHSGNTRSCLISGWHRYAMQPNQNKERATAADVAISKKFALLIVDKLNWTSDLMPPWRNLFRVEWCRSNKNAAVDISISIRAITVRVLNSGLVRSQSLKAMTLLTTCGFFYCSSTSLHSQLYPLHNHAWMDLIDTFLPALSRKCR